VSSFYWDDVTGTAGVSPASSDKFAQVTGELVSADRVAFNEGGRDARGPSESGSVLRRSMSFHDFHLIETQV